MKALFVCRNLMKSIKRKEIETGLVHSVFSNACNIETGNAFITLLGSDRVMVPMSAIVASNEKIDFNKLNIQKKMIIYFDEKSIFCQDRAMSISLEGVQIWHPNPVLKPSVLSEKEVLENIKAVEMGLNTNGKPYGMYPMIAMLKKKMPELELADFKAECKTTDIDFIKYRFVDFINAFIELNVEKIPQKALSIIGFGIGLTPAMDDFISGMMLSLVYMGFYYKMNVSRIYMFNQALIGGSLNKTTKVSAEMLKHAVVGETNQAAQGLLQAILYQKDEKEIIKAIVKTISIGATSGSDMVLGIYVGSKILTNYKYRGGWSNGFVYSCEERQLL